jgi:ring-1,2-phenylacetyl-CoA epoxidase subunit PaaE
MDALEPAHGAVAGRGVAAYACLGGACGTCKARITTGAVSMEQNFALNTAEVEAGLILTCQSHPTTATVAVDYDS